MKKTAGIYLFLISTALFAQTNKAILAHKNSDLKTAKAIVDSLSFLSAFDQDAELWYVKGLVYETIYSKNDSLINYINDHPLKVAYVAYKKAKDAPKNKRYNLLASKRIDSVLCVTFLVEANKLAERKNLADAVEMAKLYTQARPADTLGYIQLSQFAEKAKDYATSKSTYLKLLEIGYIKPYIYKDLLYVLYNIDNNTLETDKYLTIAQNYYPLDFDFKRFEINMLLVQKKYTTAIKLTENLIKDDQENKALYLFNIGSIYQLQDSVQKAEVCYKMAITSNAEYFDAYYNIGGLYYENARKIYTQVNEMDYGTYQKIGRKKEAEANLIAKQALPYFEKAWQIKKDEELKGVLTDLYKNLKLSVKLK